MRSAYPMKQVLIIVSLLIFAIGCTKNEENEKANVILYDFMGSEMMPVPGVVILKQEPGYIKIRLASGGILEHTGRYSVIRMPKQSSNPIAPK